MASSGSDKQFPNQRGFPTPNNAPDESVCRVLSLPAQEDYLALAMGALDALRKPYNWFKNGDLTPDEAALLFAGILDAAYEQALSGQCDPDVPTPFWDTPEDADDMVPVGEQVWYGTAIVTYASPPEVTFVEQLAIWTIAGFLAYSGAVASAIAFLTIAPRFVLAFKTGDAGAIIDIIIDSSRVGRYNTYSASPGILRVPVACDPDLDEHQIYIVKDDDPDTTIQVVRDELNPNDVSPTNRRYNPDTDKVEVLNPDDTWTANDGADPRTNTGGQFAPPVADDVRCQAAANMSRWYEDLIDGVLVNIGFASGGVGLMTVLLAALEFLGPFGILLDLILGLGFILFDAGATAISAAFTAEIYDQLTCIFYCAIDEAGVVSVDALASIQASIDTDIGGLVATVMDAMLFLQGNVGLTNCGAVGMAPANCSACICDVFCHEWFDVVGVTSIDTIGGHTFTIRAFQVFPSAEIHITKIVIDYEQTPNPGNTDDFSLVQTYDQDGFLTNNEDISDILTGQSTFTPVGGQNYVGITFQVSTAWTPEGAGYPNIPHICVEYTTPGITWESGSDC